MDWLGVPRVENTETVSFMECMHLYQDMDFDCTGAAVHFLMLVFILFFYKQTDWNKLRIQSDVSQNNWQSWAWIYKSWLWFFVLATSRFCHLFQHIQVMRIMFILLSFFMDFLSSFCKQTIFTLPRSYCQCWFLSLYLNINLHPLKIVLCTWLLIVLNYEHRKSV